MKERRKAVRAEKRLPLMYWVGPSKDGARSLTKSIGGGGVCLYADQVVPVGTTLQVKVRLPDQERSLQFTAEVTWCRALKSKQSARAHLVGVRFLNIAAAHKQAILRHCLKAAPPVKA